MCPSIGSAALARGILPVAAALAAAIAPPADAQERLRLRAEVKVIVPAYFYPTWWVGSPWDDLTRAAPVIPIEAIMNPASGPGSGPNPDYERAVGAFREAGGTLLGYVPTGYGGRAIAEVVADVEAYLAWYEVDGIFLDEMGDQLGGLDYARLYHYIKWRQFALGRRLRVVGNAGMPFPQVEAFMGAVDTLVIYEGPLTNADPWGASFEAYPDQGPYAGLPPWFLNYRPARLANLVYGVPTAEAMRAALRKALQYNASYVYLTDDDIVPDWNPWDTLPSYWDQMVRTIRRVNAAR